MNENLPALRQNSLPVQQLSAMPAIRFSATDIDTIKKSLCPKDITDSELKVFLHACMQTGLSPLLGQIYPLKTRGGIKPYVGVDGYRALAEKTGLFGGVVGPLWCGSEKPPQWTDAWLEDEPPVACKVGIIRKDWEQVTWGFAKLSSCIVDSNENYRKRPEHMIAVRAECQAFRKAFPQIYNILGKYDPEQDSVKPRKSWLDQFDFAGDWDLGIVPDAMLPTSLQGKRYSFKMLALDYTPKLWRSELDGKTYSGRQWVRMMETHRDPDFRTIGQELVKKYPSKSNIQPAETQPVKVIPPTLVTAGLTETDPKPNSNEDVGFKQEETWAKDRE